MSLPSTAECTEDVTPHTATFSEVVRMAMDVTVPLTLLQAACDEPPPAGYLLYNAALVEVRDFARFLHGLHSRYTAHVLCGKDIESFFVWFQTFFSLLTALLDASGGSRAGERVKEACWDVLNLKAFLRNGTANGDVTEMILLELLHDGEVVAAHVVAYFYATVFAETDSGEKSARLSFDETCKVEATLMRTLVVSDAGRLLICAIARPFPHKPQRNGFVEKALLATPPGVNNKGGASNASVRKLMRKFKKGHTELVDQIASVELRIDQQHLSA